MQNFLNISRSKESQSNKLVRLFGHAGKQLDKKSKFNFKIYDLTRWITNNSDAKIYQFLKK